MLNVKITNRMSHEDYIATEAALPYVLPRRNIIAVGVTIILCAAIIIPMPSTWKALTDSEEPSLSEGSLSYLTETQHEGAQNVENDPRDHQENYEDYLIPDDYFPKSGTTDHASTDSTESTEGNDEGLVDENALAENSDTKAPPTNTTKATEQSKDMSESTMAGTEEKGTDSTLATTDTTPPQETTTDTTSQNKNEMNASVPAIDPHVDDKDTQNVLASNNDVDVITSGAHSNTQFGSPEDAKPAEVRPEGKWYVYTVKSGDNLSNIFTTLSLPYATLNRVTKVAKNNDLRLNIDDPIFFLIDKENVVKEIVKPISKDEQVRFTRLESTDDFKVVYEAMNTHMEESLIAKTPDASTMPLAVAAAKERAEKEALLAKQRAEQAARDKANNVNPNRPRLIISKINAGESFYRAAFRAGLTPNDIKVVERIFKNKLDIYKLKPGDQFRVLFSGIGTNAQLYAVQFSTSRGKFESFINPEDSNYYGENEFTPTAGIFRRFPLAGEIKVTSNFNPHRRHPVTGRISPHNGVDFKAVVGTPVYAPADGVVTFSGYQRAAGYYLIMRHSNNFSTVYMHLSKSEVKAGQKVIVGQLIARTGNTGRTTGPHLHYEIRINDLPVDPLKIELPSSNHPNLAREQREAFANNVKLLRADLANERLAATKK